MKSTRLAHRLAVKVQLFLIILSGAALIAPAAHARKSPTQTCQPPYTAATEAELNEAIACVNAAGAGSHIISLDGDIILTASTLPLNNPLATGLTIQGNGHTVDGAGSGTIFTIEAGTTALINNVRLTGGQGSRGAGSDWGGAVFNQGHLTLTNSTLADNEASYGGAIVNNADGGIADLTISDTTISSNVAASAGGGISILGENGGTASLAIINSTLSGNSAGAGGGLSIEGNGGNAQAIIVLTTLSANDATEGSGVYVTTTDVDAVEGNASAVFNGTLIANGPGDGSDCARANDGVLISQGFNLAADDTCNLLQASDLPSTAPVLLPLALYTPGATETHALSYGSPAIDRIPLGAVGCGTAIAADQRDEPRPQPTGGLCDIGAFERGPGDPPGNHLFLPVNLVGEE